MHRILEDTMRYGYPLRVQMTHLGHTRDWILHKPLDKYGPNLRLWDATMDPTVPYRKPFLFPKDTIVKIMMD